MPITLAESATFAPTIDVPQDGDAAQATAPGSPAGNATIEEVVQNLANRTRFLYQDPAGLIVPRPTLSCDASGNLILGGLQRILVGGDRWAQSGSATMLVGTLVAATWYYLYAWSNGSTLKFEVSTTAPDPLTGYVTKTGDATRIYLGPFRTHRTTTAIEPFRYGNGRFLWRWSALSGLSEGTVTTTAAATVATNLTLGFGGGAPLLVPPHARTAVLSLAYAAGGGFSSLGTGGDAVAAQPTYQVSAGANAQCVELECDGSNRIAYANSAGGGALSVFVLGFQE